MDSACGDNNDDGGIDNFGFIDSNDGDDANSGNSDRKLHCPGDLHSVSSDGKDNDGVADDGVFTH